MIKSKHDVKFKTALKTEIELQKVRNVIQILEVTRVVLMKNSSVLL